MNYILHLFRHQWVYLTPSCRQCRYCGELQRRNLMCKRGVLVELWVTVPASHLDLIKGDNW
jgi:hypothetical protein